MLDLVSSCVEQYSQLMDGVLGWCVTPKRYRDSESQLVSLV